MTPEEHRYFPTAAGILLGLGYVIAGRTYFLLNSASVFVALSVSSA